MEEHLRSPKKRWARVTAAVIVACLLLPSVAHAKGPGLDHATLEGPGIPEAIHLPNRYPYLLNDAAMSHLFTRPQSAGFSRGRPVAVDELGPRYELTYRLGFGSTLVVDLYPYAARGAIAYVAPGQFASVPVGNSDAEVRFPAAPGWLAYRPRLIRWLQREGLPEGEPSRRSGALLTGALAGAVGFLGLFVALRRRRRVSLPRFRASEAS
jgi:hypothetical protein